MGLSLDEFKDFLDKDLKWRYEPIDFSCFSAYYQHI